MAFWSTTGRAAAARAVDSLLTAYGAGVVASFVTLCSANTVNALRDHPANGWLRRHNPHEISLTPALYMVGAYAKSGALALAWPLTTIEAKLRHDRDGHWHHFLFPEYPQSQLHKEQMLARWKSRDATRRQRERGQRISEDEEDAAAAAAARAAMKALL